MYRKYLIQSFRYAIVAAFSAYLGVPSHASDDIIGRLSEQYDVSRLEFGLFMIKSKISDAVTERFRNERVFESGPGISITPGAFVSESGLIFSVYIDSFRTPDLLKEDPGRFEWISDRAAESILRALGNWGDASGGFHKQLGGLFSSEPELQPGMRLLMKDYLSLRELGSAIADASQIHVHVALGREMKSYRYKTAVEYNGARLPETARELISAF